MNDNKHDAAYHGGDDETQHRSYEEAQRLARPFDTQRDWPISPEPPVKKKRRWPWILGGVVVGLFAIGQCAGPGVEENTNRVLESTEQTTQPTEEPPTVEEKDETTEPTPEQIEDPPAPTGLSDVDREYVATVRENTTALGPWTDAALVEFAAQMCAAREAGATNDEIHRQLQAQHRTEVYLDLAFAMGAGYATYCPNYL